MSRSDAREWDKLTRDQHERVVSWLQALLVKMREERGAMMDRHGFDLVGALEALVAKLGGSGSRSR